MHQGKGRMEEGGRRGPWRGLMCPDLGVKSGRTKACGSALTKLTPTTVGPSATVNNTPKVRAGVAEPRRQLTLRRATDHDVMF